MLMIFAIGFSGFSAAAHAFDMESCGSMTMTQIDDAGMAMPDCSDHKAAQDQGKATDHHKGANGKCLDCTHCCMSHAMAIHDYSVDFPRLVTVHVPSPADVNVGDYRFSLLRPPKSLA